MVRWDDFLQLIQAQPAHSTLQAIAREAETYPMGREMNSTTGLKMKAMASNATVEVYPVPVDFWESNIMLTILS